jgi:hypothetical protein
VSFCLVFGFVVLVLHVFDDLLLGFWGFIYLFIYYTSPSGFVGFWMKFTVSIFAEEHYLYFVFN